MFKIDMVNISRVLSSRINSFLLMSVSSICMALDPTESKLLTSFHTSQKSTHSVASIFQPKVKAKAKLLLMARRKKMISVTLFLFRCCLVVFKEIRIQKICFVGSIYGCFMFSQLHTRL